MGLPDSFHELFDKIAEGIIGVNPTEIFNEGWMLRLLIYKFSEGEGCFPFKLMNNSKWFSEVQLSTPFKHRKRKDQLAETRTHVDGVIGQLEIEENTKAGIKLLENASQFIVLEAKMSSPLSGGVTNAPGYDQAARSVACMAKTIENSKIKPVSLKSVGFYVLAPQSQIEKGLFADQLLKTNIREKISTRIKQYKNDLITYTMLQRFDEEFIEPLLQEISIKSVTYEELIKCLDTDSKEKEKIWIYYKNCLKYNGLT